MSGTSVFNDDTTVANRPLKSGVARRMPGTFVPSEADAPKSPSHKPLRAHTDTTARDTRERGVRVGREIGARDNAQEILQKHVKQLEEQAAAYQRYLEKLGVKSMVDENGEVVFEPTNTPQENQDASIDLEQASKVLHHLKQKPRLPSIPKNSHVNPAKPNDQLVSVPIVPTVQPHSDSEGKDVRGAIFDQIIEEERKKVEAENRKIWEENDRLATQKELSKELALVGEEWVSVKNKASEFLQEYPDFKGNEEIHVSIARSDDMFGVLDHQINADEFVGLSDQNALSSFSSLVRSIQEKVTRHKKFLDHGKEMASTLIASTKQATAVTTNFVDVAKVNQLPQAESQVVEVTSPEVTIPEAAIQQAPNNDPQLANKMVQAVFARIVAEATNWESISGPIPNKAKAPTVEVEKPQAVLPWKNISFDDDTDPGLPKFIVDFFGTNSSPRKSLDSLLLEYVSYANKDNTTSIANLRTMDCYRLLNDANSESIAGLNAEQRKEICVFIEKLGEVAWRAETALETDQKSKGGTYTPLNLKEIQKHISVAEYYDAVMRVAVAAEKIAPNI